jgi:hypothetical protein
VTELRRYEFRGCQDTDDWTWTQYPGDVVSLREHFRKQGIEVATEDVGRAYQSYSRTLGVEWLRLMSITEGLVAAVGRWLGPCDAPRELRFEYRNHRGEVGVRRVTPRRLWFGVTAWYLDAQWLLDAWDHDRAAVRTFAVVGILRFIAVTESAGD